MSSGKNKLLIITVVIFVVLIVTIGYGIKVTSKPEFCASCHQIKPAVESWAKGSHASTECLICHADPGLMGKIKVKLGGLREVAIQVSNPPTVDALVAHVPAQRCLTCHKKFEFDNPDLNKLHSKKEINCGPCHRQAIHKSN